MLRARDDFYAGGRPTVADVLLLIEVMDSSVETDRRIKLPLYARAGIVETWLIDLTTDRIDAFRRPAETGYGDTQSVGRGQSLSLVVFPEITIPVEELIG